MRKIKKHYGIIQKHEILLHAKKQLKEEFVGIDSVIDQVIDLCSSWYLLPNLQDKPVIINLWGLTGVGKSSLVNRLSELLNFTEKYYRFNLNDENNYLSIRDRIANIFENDNGFPIIIAFDEFQHARSIDDFGNEIGKSHHKIIWEILDSGKFALARDNFRIEDIHKLVLKLEYALSNHIEVHNGVVTKREKYFKNIIRDKEYIFNEENPESKGVVYFVPEEYHMKIYDLAKDKFNTPLDVNQQLSQLDGRQTISLLYEVLSFSISPRIYDCSRSIIFVLGNLDEAYTMSSSYNPDMDADEFHQQSLKINISDIKDALRKRFRNEQISRLGNNHIIYPSFSRDTFEKIINLEINKIILKVRNEFQISLKVDHSLLELIYDEGVYPTQGTRPVLSTIYQMIGSKVGKMISQIYLNHFQADSIHAVAANNEIKFIYFKDKQLIFSFKDVPVLNLLKLRENKKDDMQAIVAVHESGHALISIFLLNTIPDIIYSKTADVHSNGFVFTNFKWKYISRKEILSRIAFYLGGIIAEKLIFGEENITNGSENDIEKATAFVTGMLKDSGMGDLPASYQVEDIEANYKLFDFKNDINSQVRKMIEQAELLVLQTLKKQQLLLIHMADYLSDHRVLHKIKIKDLLNKYAEDFNLDRIIENGEHLFYRDHLKEKLRKLNLQEDCFRIKNGFSINKTIQ